MQRKRTQSDFFRMNNNIFDMQTDENGQAKPALSAIQMCVLAALYSLAPFNTYRVKVRQSVLAERCGCSISTIKRAVDGLFEKKYIKSAARDEVYAGDMKLLGTYTYVLPAIVKKGYFYVSRKALAVLDKLQTRVYLFLCKCSRRTMDCWNSFSDIARQLKLQRNAVVKTIRELAKEQIHLAFEQSEKEVSNLHQRTKEGIETARRNGKQIGRQQGSTVTTKKSVQAKKVILKYSKDFNGTLSDVDCIRLIGIARNTYYKYKAELRECTPMVYD